MTRLQDILGTRESYMQHVCCRVSDSMRDEGYVVLAEQLFPFFQAVHGEGARLQFVTVDISFQHSILIARLFHVLGLSLKWSSVSYEFDSYMIGE